MALKLQIARILGAAALLAALSFAPSAASAHAGHQHKQATAIQQTQPEAQTPAAHRAIAPADIVIDAEVTTASTSPSIPSSDVTCDGFGCCSSGPCTGCHGAVLAASSVPIPP